MPSGAADSGPYVRRLDEREYLGKKGRSLPGSHRPRGLFIAAGPRVIGRGQRELTIADASACVLARMDVAQPEGASGHVPEGLLAEGPTARALPPALAPTRTRGDASALERRLRALGYID
jgi:hypothetical protein